MERDTSARCWSFFPFFRLQSPGLLPVLLQSLLLSVLGVEILVLIALRRLISSHVDICTDLYTRSYAVDI